MTLSSIILPVHAPPQSLSPFHALFSIEYTQQLLLKSIKINHYILPFVFIFIIFFEKVFWISLFLQRFQFLKHLIDDDRITDVTVRVRGISNVILH